jgi:hypothetical protein
MSPPMHAVMLRTILPRTGASERWKLVLSLVFRSRYAPIGRQPWSCPEAAFQCLLALAAHPWHAISSEIGGVPSIAELNRLGEEKQSLRYADPRIFHKCRKGTIRHIDILLKDAGRLFSIHLGPSALG